MTLDRRLHAYRPDLAAESLRGRVEAKRFADGTAMQVAANVLPVYAAPEDGRGRTTELLHGETVRVYDTAGGWAWMQNDADSYVGYVRADALSAPGPASTHRVAALRSFVYAEPDLKSAVRDWRSIGSRVAAAEHKGGYVRCAGGWMFADHLAPLGDHAPDWAGTALRFLGTPYLWGGRSSLGLDCSGLVQVALGEAGIDWPRDTDMQAACGEEVPFAGDEAVLRRGDLVFWKGHVGIWADAGCFVHANATHMAVAAEPLAETMARIERQLGQRVLTVHRPKAA
ncbi:MAG: C40 family peptidase [Alphaproteobacteria bacterium]